MRLVHSRFVPKLSAAPRVSSAPQPIISHSPATFGKFKFPVSPSHSIVSLRSKSLPLTILTVNASEVETSECDPPGPFYLHQLLLDFTFMLLDCAFYSVILKTSYLKLLLILSTVKWVLDLHSSSKSVSSLFDDFSKTKKRVVDNYNKDGKIDRETILVALFPTDETSPESNTTLLADVALMKKLLQLIGQKLEVDEQNIRDHEANSIPYFSTPLPAPQVLSPTVTQSETDIYGQEASYLVAGRNLEGSVQKIQEKADFICLVLGLVAAGFVTPEDCKIIERLEAMGFDRALVLKVFLAFQKNEELALNYLLEHRH